MLRIGWTTWVHPGYSGFQKLCLLEMEGASRRFNGRLQRFALPPATRLLGALVAALPPMQLLG